MPETVWGWKAIREQIGKLMGYEPSMGTMYRWADGSVISDPIPVRTSKTGRAYAKMEELISWCKRMKE